MDVVVPEVMDFPEVDVEMVADKTEKVCSYRLAGVIKVIRKSEGELK